MTDCPRPPPVATPAKAIIDYLTLNNITRYLPGTGWGWGWHTSPEQPEKSRPEKNEFYFKRLGSNGIGSVHQSSSITSAGKLPVFRSAKVKIQILKAWIYHNSRCRAVFQLSAPLLPFPTAGGLPEKCGARRGTHWSRLVYNEWFMRENNGRSSASALITEPFPVRCIGSGSGKVAFLPRMKVLRIHAKDDARSTAFSPRILIPKSPMEISRGLVRMESGRRSRQRLTGKRRQRRQHNKNKKAKRRKKSPGPRRGSNFLWHPARAMFHC